MLLLPHRQFAPPHAFFLSPSLVPFHPTQHLRCYLDMPFFFIDPCTTNLNTKKILVFTLPVAFNMSSPYPHPSPSMLATSNVFCTVCSTVTSISLPMPPLPYSQTLGYTYLPTPLMSVTSDAFVQFVALRNQYLYPCPPPLPYSQPWDTYTCQLL